MKCLDAVADTGKRYTLDPKADKHGTLSLEKRSQAREVPRESPAVRDGLFSALKDSIHQPTKT